MAFGRKKTLAIQLCVLLVVGRLVFVAYRHSLGVSKEVDMPPLGEGTDEPNEITGLSEVLGRRPPQEAEKPKKASTPTDNKLQKGITNIKPVFALESGKKFGPNDLKSLEPLKRYPMEYDGGEVGNVAFGGGIFDETEIYGNKLPLYDGDRSEYSRENATFFSLIRNKDLKGILDSIQSVESRFNSRYHYDWVFANDVPFNPTAKKIISNMVSGNAYFVEIPKEYWTYPSWIDVDKMEETLDRMRKEKIKYGGSLSYRHMCRFNSGFFFRLPIMQKYKYYWRVEPNVKFQCDIFHKDWFKEMRANNKKYAFTLAPLELHTTVENLWETVQDFARNNHQYVAKNNNMNFLTENEGKTYNMCHFWSNFEIGDMDFYRSEAYMKFFDHIDKAGGFYYSRWGDAPIHSMAVSLFLSKDELFYFQNSGYFHPPNGDCPWDAKYRYEHRCTCLTQDEASWDKSSCIPKWFEIHGIPKPDTVPHFDFVNQHNVD